MMILKLNAYLSNTDLAEAACESNAGPCRAAAGLHGDRYLLVMHQIGTVFPTARVNAGHYRLTAKPLLLQIKKNPLRLPLNRG